MGLFGILAVARDGMAAQTAALTTTGSNVANVATPGYARRSAILESAAEGSGTVRYARTARSFDRFAYAHVVGEQSKFGAADTRSSALTEVETILAPPSNSIGDQATSLIRSFNSLAGFATDPSLREDVIARADNLATALRSTRTSLESTAANLLGRAGDTIADLNSQVNRIADLNRQIAAATGIGGDSAALRDQRDLAIRDVGGMLDLHSIEDETGRVTLFGGGAVLVQGDHPNKLSLDLDTNGDMRFFVTGAAKTDITSRIGSGVLAGLREVRDVDVKKAITDVDQYAYDVANALNAVHTTGYGSDGVTGRALFAVGTTAAGAAATIAVDPALVGHPERVGASDSTANLPGGNAIALRLANVADTQAFGGRTLADRFASMVTDIGFRKNNADAELTLRTDTLAVAESLADAANGVSLDEEMVNLSQYQRAFEASSRVLRAADELLKTLMDTI